MKKAQGLPITTIIIVLLALIVLVVVIAMFVQKTSKTGEGLKEIQEATCDKAGGTPKPYGTECTVIYGSFKDTGVSKICCKKGSFKDEQKSPV